MDRTKLVVLGLLAVWGGLTASRVVAQQSLARAEVCRVDSARRNGMERVLAEFKSKGALVAQKDGQTEIVYHGTPEEWTGLVNRLLEFPFPWASWQTRMDSSNSVEGRVIL